MRADAQRNHDAVLAAAKAVFAQAGIDAPMEDVARAAGVGKGTSSICKSSKLPA